MWRTVILRETCGCMGELMTYPCGTSFGVYWGALMCSALQRECSGILSGDKKALEWPEARMTESLLKQRIRKQDPRRLHHLQVFYPHCHKVYVSIHFNSADDMRRTGVVIMTMSRDNYVFQITALIQWTTVIICDFDRFNKLPKTCHLHVGVI